MVPVGRVRRALPRRRRAVAAVVTAVLAGFVVVVGATEASAATVDPNGWYVLVNRNSGKAMDNSGFATNDGAAVAQWARHDGANQQWRFLDSGGGYYRLQNRHSGKVLDDYGWSTTAGTDIVQWSDANATNQQFQLADSSDGYVRFINRHSGMAVEVKDGSTADGGNVVQYWDWGGNNQQWQLVRVGNVSGGSLPSTFQWSSSGVLAGPKPNATYNAVSTKDYSVVRHNNEWLIYATYATTEGWWGMEFFKFGDWSQAASAPHTYLDDTPLGGGYRAAPQVFYFAPQNLWYMVYQTGPPTYSTSTDPSNPNSWSPQRRLMDTEPPIVQQYGGWLDFWVICDAANCYLFFPNDNGQIFRAQTTVANFPNGFGNTTLVMSDTAANLFEAVNVYKVAGTDQYLMLVEAYGPTNRRYFRSFTATSLTGTWTPLAATEASPFAGRNNVTFSGTPWTQDISHGELVRAGNDQTLPINPCNLQFVYQGVDPDSKVSYSQLPYRMGLLTQTNSAC